MRITRGGLPKNNGQKSAEGIVAAEGGEGLNIKVR